MTSIGAIVAPHQRQDIWRLLPGWAVGVHLPLQYRHQGKGSQGKMQPHSSLLPYSQRYACSSAKLISIIIVAPYGPG
jgi:hypothetical protein